MNSPTEPDLPHSPERTAEPNAAIALLKRRIIDDPQVILQDREVMRALIGADGQPERRNVVDLRGRLVERLEARLDRLEETHRTVIAAAYDNLSGTNQVHRAVLALLDAADFHVFLGALAGEVADILAVDAIRLGLETTQAMAGTPLGPDGPLRRLAVTLPRGGVALYVTQGRETAPRKVTLRPCEVAVDGLYGEDAPRVRSEAVLRLDLGFGRLPALIAFGAEDPQRFHPDQGTDLLKFLAGATERMLRRLLE
jgi:uncharacterized protein YigA (DUF484 family)